VNPVRFSTRFASARLCASFALFLAASGLSSFGQPAQPGRAALPAGVEIRVAANPAKATVGDPIQINIDVVHPGDVAVKVPSPGERLGDFTVLEFLPGPLPSPGDSPRQDKRLRHRARLLVALFRTGEFEFPPVPIILETVRERTQAATQPVKVSVASVITEKDPALKDLKKQAEIEDPFPWRTAIILGILFLLLLAGLALWLRRRRRARPIPSAAPQPLLSPLELAEAELRDLLTRGLIEKGFIKSFYVELSEIVKRVLEAGFSISTSEKTTAEIMYALQGSPAGPAGSPRMERVETLLLECDLVKFAKYIPSRQETDAAVVAAFAVLQDCRQLKSAAVAGEAPVGGAT
jgi:hypothetical protein